MPTELLDTNTTFLYNGLNITLSADNTDNTVLNGSVNGACNEYNYSWFTRNISLPHFYQIDFGTEVTIKKICFNPINAIIYSYDCLVKYYNIQYSFDGINFENIYSMNQFYDSSKGSIGSIVTNQANQYYEDCINEFDPIKTRYIRITIYNSYDKKYKWTGFCNLRIYSESGEPNDNKIFLDKNNYIYGVG